MNTQLKSLMIVGGALLAIGMAAILAYLPLFQVLALPGEQVGMALANAIPALSEATMVLGAVLLGGGVLAHVTIEALAERLGRKGPVQIINGQRHPHDAYGADWDPDS